MTVAIVPPYSRLRGGRVDAAERTAGGYYGSKTEL
jgi:hypothetical protein